jgi:hypothetical protein
LGGYVPVFRHVCRRWRDARVSYKDPALDLAKLAFLGHRSLLCWVAELRQEAGHQGVALEAARRVLAGAARGGHEAIVRLAKSWGATNFVEAMAEAAFGGHGAIVCLARERAAEISRATAGAAQSGHAVSGVTPGERAANAYSKALHCAARGGHEDLVLLAVKSRRDLTPKAGRH